MKRSLWRWSRALHKWIGIYVCVLTLIWLLELVLLPVTHAPHAALDWEPYTPTFKSTPNRSLNIPELFSMIREGKYGISPRSELTGYDPITASYTVRDPDSFMELRIDAESGVVLDSRLDTETMFSEKCALGWLHPLLKRILSAPFESAFVLLAVTGAHLLWGPPRKKAADHSLPSLRPGMTFRLPPVADPQNMGRMVALGLFPGALVKILHAPARGPLVLSVRHTRIAVGRDFAGRFIPHGEHL